MQAKILIIMVFFVICGSNAYADYDVTDLETLFTNKQQRAQIDAVRSGGYQGSTSSQTHKVKVTGYMTRSDGKSVVWMNNKNTLASPKMGDVRIHQSNVGRNKKVTVTIDGETVRLKPGETWSEGSGVSDTAK